MSSRIWQSWILVVQGNSFRSICMNQVVLPNFLGLVDWPVVWLCSAVAFLLLLVYAFAVVRKYIRILVDRLDDHIPPARPDYDGGESILRAGRRVQFPAVDGHPIEGVIMSGNPGMPRRGMIVFAHEVGSDRRSGPRYCRGLLDAGFDVFLFDFRGHGTTKPESGYRPWHWPTDRERADMLGAIAYIGSYLEREGRPREVGLFGLSRGAGAAILASAESDCVAGIVTDGAFSSDMTLEFLMKRFAKIFVRIRIIAENHPRIVWRFIRWLAFRECERKYDCRFPSVRKALLRLGKTPILFIHGEKDSYIPIAQSQALYDLAAGPKYLWVVPRAKHNQSVLVAPNEYAARVIRFFREHLTREAVCDEPRPRRRTRRTVSRLLSAKSPFRGSKVSAVAKSSPVD